MFDELLKNVRKEYPVIGRWLTCFIVCFVSLNWYYTSVIDNAKNMVELYQAKLQVTSPDDAAKKWEALNKQMDIAQSAVRDLLESRLKSYVPADGMSLLEPICVSGKDVFTDGTAKQILIYNESLMIIHNKKYDCKTAKWTESGKP